MTAQNDRPPPPAENGEPTQALSPPGGATGVLAPADEAARVLPSVGEATRVLSRPADATRVLAPEGGATGVLAPEGEATGVLAPEGEATQALVPAAEHAATVHLGLTDSLTDSPMDGPTDVSTGDPAPSDGLGPAGAPAPAPSAAPRPADAEYSATVLASHWIQRPEPDGTLPEEPSTARTRPAPAADRTEGSVLRFGPGVTAAVAQRTHRTLPAVLPPPAAPRRRLRRHALPALVVLLVLAFLVWQRLGPPVAVRTVAVEARPAALGCDGTADIVGLVTTNGRPGTLSYRWIRSDGTASAVLREVVVRGQRQARLHLRWTFQGQGHRKARAELRILSPAHRPVTTRVTYACP